MRWIYFGVIFFTFILIIATPAFFTNDLIAKSDFIVALGCVLFLIEILISKKADVLTKFFAFLGLMYLFFTAYHGDETIIYMLRIEAYLLELNIEKPMLLKYVRIPFWLSFILFLLCTVNIIIFLIRKTYFYLRRYIF
jgi:hypothetical protein